MLHHLHQGLEQVPVIDGILAGRQVVQLHQGNGIGAVAHRHGKGGVLGVQLLVDVHGAGLHGLLQPGHGLKVQGELQPAGQPVRAGHQPAIPLIRPVPQVDGHRSPLHDLLDHPDGADQHHPGVGVIQILGDGIKPVEAVPGHDDLFLQLVFHVQQLPVEVFQQAVAFLLFLVFIVEIVVCIPLFVAPVAAEGAGHTIDHKGDPGPHIIKHIGRINPRMQLAAQVGHHGQGRGQQALAHAKGDGHNHHIQQPHIHKPQVAPVRGDGCHPRRNHKQQQVLGGVVQEGVDFGPLPAGLLLLKAVFLFPDPLQLLDDGLGPMLRKGVKGHPPAQPPHIPSAARGAPLFQPAIPDAPLPGRSPGRRFTQLPDRHRLAGEQVDGAGGIHVQQPVDGIRRIRHLHQVQLRLRRQRADHVLLPVHGVEDLPHRAAAFHHPFPVDAAHPHRQQGNLLLLAEGGGDPLGGPQLFHARGQKGLVLQAQGGQKADLLHLFGGRRLEQRRKHHQQPAPFQLRPGPETFPDGPGQHHNAVHRLAFQDLAALLIIHRPPEHLAADLAAPQFPL